MLQRLVALRLHYFSSKCDRKDLQKSKGKFSFFRVVAKCKSNMKSWQESIDGRQKCGRWGIKSSFLRRKLFIWGEKKEEMRDG